MKNESGTKKLRLYWGMSVVAFIITWILLSIASNLNGSYGMVLFCAIISLVMPILTLAEIGSLKKKNGGMPIGKTKGKKILSIVFLIFSYLIVGKSMREISVEDSVMRSSMKDKSIATRNEQETIAYSDEGTKAEDETATEDTVWSPLPMKDEFGDPIDGQTNLIGSFQDDEGRTLVVGVTYNNELGPIIALSIINSSGTSEMFPASLSSSYPVELKMKVGSDVYQYRLFVNDDTTILTLMDYYSYLLQQSEALLEGYTGEEKDFNGLMEQLDEVTGGKVSEEKSLYDVKGMISLLYNGQEDIPCVISNGMQKYSFTIQPANFKSAFDNIWDYSEVCAENDKLEKKDNKSKNEITKETKESKDDLKKDGSESSENNKAKEKNTENSGNNKAKENDSTENEANEDSVRSLDIEFPQCPISFNCSFDYYIQIDSFEATTESYGGDIRINYKVKGTTSNDNGSAFLKVTCYDSDGYSVDNSMIRLDSATANEPFKIKDSIVVDASTARIEFVAP